MSVNAEILLSDVCADNYDALAIPGGFEEYGAVVVNEPVVRTDNIITSYCPQTGPDVAFMLLEELVGSEKMRETRTAMGF